MKLTIFGATGRTGTELLTQALDGGHEVTVVVRDPARLAADEHPRLRVVTADVRDPDAITPAVDGADAVLSALGPSGRGPSTICADGARSIGVAMAKTGVRRLLLVSAAGLIADAGDGFFVRYVVKPMILERLLANGFADMRRSEEEVRSGDLDWTILRPPQLTEAKATGNYRTATDLNLRGGRKISRADLAACMLGLITDDASVRHHVSVAY
jgi:putative NADH-flavin reductase